MRVPAAGLGVQDVWEEAEDAGAVLAAPIGFVRCGRAACRVTKVLWKIGKETGGKKMEELHSLKSNEMAEVQFTPQQPLVVDTFKSCEGLSRIAFLDGNGVVMLGKIVKKTDKVEAAKGKK